MNLTTDRPLSELWTEDQRRLHARELDLIIARHRFAYSICRSAAETKPSRKIYE